jgi:hypothetical protein
MTVKFSIDPRTMPNGTVLQLGIRYIRQPGEGDLEATRGMASPQVYTYALMKAGGLWYTTGSGKVPQSAGWGAVERWLGRDGREVVWAKVAADWADLWERPVRCDTSGCGLSVHDGPHAPRPLTDAEIVDELVGPASP